MQRKEVLLSLKFVDKVIKVPDNPTYKTYYDLVKKIKPSAIAITEDDPIRLEKQRQAKAVGAKLKTIRKFKNHSSSRIKKLLLNEDL